MAEHVAVALRRIQAAFPAWDPVLPGAFPFREEDRGLVIARRQHAGAGPVPNLHLRGCDGSLLLIGEDAVPPMGLRIYGPRNVVLIGRGVDLSGAVCTLSGSDNVLAIGAFTTARLRATFLVAGPGGGVFVGEDCMILEGAILSNSDGHAIFDAANGQRLNADRDVVVEDHVLIGTEARVNKGTRLGEGCVVDHYATVHGRVEPGTLMAGTPAQAVRRGIAWSRGIAATLDEAEAQGEPARIRAARLALRCPD